MGYRFHMARNKEMAERNKKIKELAQENSKKKVAEIMGVGYHTVCTVINNPLSHYWEGDDE